MKAYRLESKFGRLLMLFAVKLLYVILTVNELGDLWYIGYGSYGVDFNAQREALGMVAFIFMSVFFVNMRPKGRFIDALMTMLFVIYYIPLNSAYSLNNTDVTFFIKSNIYFFLVVLCINFFVKPQYKQDINSNLKNKEKDQFCVIFSTPLVNLLCLGICVFCIAYKISYNGLSFFVSLTSDDIYSVRSEFQSSMDAMSGSIFSYVFSVIRNLADYIVPIYLYCSLVQRKYVETLISFACILSLFSISSSKATLVFTVIVFIFAFLRKTVFVKKFCHWFTVGIITLLCICVLELVLFKSNVVYMFLIRRIFYYPAWLNSLYYEFFDQGVKVFWTQDTFLLQMIFPAQYPQGILDSINNHFYQGNVPSPNTGLFAEAYMHFGDLGIVIYPFLLTSLLKFSQKTLSAYGNEFSILVAVKLVLQITNVPMVRTDFVLSFVLFILLLRFLPMFVLGKRLV